MATIAQLTDINRVHDVYYWATVSARRPSSIPSSSVAIVGTASRGALDTPTYVGAPDEFRRLFGGIVASPADPSTPLSGYLSFLGVAYQGVVTKIFVRVADSNCATAYVTLKATTNNVMALHASSPGTWASALAVTVVAGTAPNTLNLTVLNNATGERAQMTGLSYPDVPTLVAAINANAQMAALVSASMPVVDPPAQPTVTASGTGGTIPTSNGGKYYFKVTYFNAVGETTGSAESAQVTVLTGQAVNLTVALPTAPTTDATGWKLYATPEMGAQGTEVFVGQSTVFGSNVAFSSFASSQLQPPTRNTCVRAAATAALPDNATGTLAFSTTSSAGVGAGNDGASANAARHVGQLGTPSTGASTLATLSEPPTFVVLAEAAGTDTSQWAAQAALAQTNSWIAVVCPPKNTVAETLTSAVGGLLTTAPVSTLLSSSTAPYIKVAYPWIKILESEVYNAVLLSSGASWFAGLSAAQFPNTSAATKPLSNVVDAEFRLSRTQINTLVTANVNAAWTGAPRHGLCYGSDLMLSGENGFATRMRQLIGEGLMGLFGDMVDVPNKQSLWDEAQQRGMSYLDGLARIDLIPANPSSTPAVAAPAATSTTKGTGKTAPGTPAGTAPSASAPATATDQNYNVICDATNNIINGVATNVLYIDVWVRLYPNTDRVLLRVSIGTDISVG